MTPEWREKLIASQHATRYTHLGHAYDRVPYGTENPRWGESPCRGCGAIKGELHVFGDCEYEACPVCNASQIGSCGCDIDEFREPGDIIAQHEVSKRGDRILATVLAFVIVLCMVATIFAVLRLR